MDRLDAMAVFQAAVEAGSLSGAGRKLGMPLATVSRKLSDLEAHLKARLLVRSTRKLTLTDAGRAYYTSCKRILEDVQEAELTANGEYTAPKGELILTAPVVFGRLHVVPIVAEFLDAYPQVDVRLHLGDRIANLLDDHIDLAVRIGELPDSTLSATRVGTVYRVLCASPDYLNAHGMPTSPDQLAAHQIIAFDALMSTGAWTFRTNGAEVSVPIRPRLIVNTAEAAMDAALLGFGITRVLSYQMASAAKAGLLRVVLADHERAALPVNLIYSRQGLLPVKLRAFLDFALPRLRTRMKAL
ncbi:MAG: LysR family transcriptional regulator [Steroidobacteraceae bacterium]